MGVNAIACIPKHVEDPAYRAGSWPAFLGGMARAPSAEQAVPQEPTPWWNADIGRAAAGTPAFGDTLLAVLAVDGRLTVLHWETGRILWSRRLDGFGHGGPLLAQSRLYAATSGDKGRVYALDVRVGRTIWEHEAGALVGTPALASTRLIVVTEGGRVLGLETDSGAVAWERRVQGSVRTGPTVVGDRVVIGTDDSLHVFRARDGEEAMAAAGSGPMVSPPAAVGDTLVTASPEGRVTGFRVAPLERLWTVSVNHPVMGTPAVARDTVFVTSVDGRLWGIPLAAPHQFMTTAVDAAIRAGPSPVRNGVLVGTIRGEILLVTGGAVTEPRLRVDGPLDAPPLVHRGALVVVDGRGRVRTWR